MTPSLSTNPSSCILLTQSVDYYIFQSKILSENHKAHFEEEIKTLSGALKAQYDKANKEYEGI